MNKIFIAIVAIGVFLVTSCEGSDSCIETLPNEKPGTNPYVTIASAGNGSSTAPFSVSLRKVWAKYIALVNNRI